MVTCRSCDAILLGASFLSAHSRRSMGRGRATTICRFPVAAPGARANNYVRSRYYRPCTRTGNLRTVALVNPAGSSEAENLKLKNERPKRKTRIRLSIWSKTCERRTSVEPNLLKPIRFNNIITTVSYIQLYRLGVTNYIYICINFNVFIVFI